MTKIKDENKSDSLIFMLLKIAYIFSFLTFLFVCCFSIWDLNILNKPVLQNSGFTFNETYYMKFSQKEYFPLIDYEKLTSFINTSLGNEVNNYGVFIHNFTDNKTLVINGDVIFPATSLSKVPIVILALRDIDNNKYTLNKILSEKTLDYHLSNMIIESDNDSMMIVENFLGGWQVVDKRIEFELGISPYFRYPYKATVNNVGKVFIDLYHQNILSKKNNNYLLDLLKNTASRYQDRIVAGLPENTIVAHKIGQDISSNGWNYNDAGIVYSGNSDFVIVFMNTDVQKEEAINKIKIITKKVYETFNNY